MGSVPAQVVEVHSQRERHETAAEKVPEVGWCDVRRCWYAKPIRGSEEGGEREVGSRMALLMLTDVTHE
jgi:hypothetical protein